MDMPNKAEFVSYFVTFQLGNGGEVAKHLQQLPSDILKSPEVSFVVQVWGSLKTEDYAQFFRLLRKADILQASLMHRYVGEMRFKALKKMVKTFNAGKGSEFPLADYVEKFMFETEEEAIEFLEHCGLEVESSNGAMMVLFNSQNIDSLLPRDKNDHPIYPVTHYMPYHIDGCKGNAPDGRPYTAAEISRGLFKSVAKPLKSEIDGKEKERLMKLALLKRKKIQRGFNKSEIAVDTAPIEVKEKSISPVEDAEKKKKMILLSGSLSSGREGKRVTSPPVPSDFDPFAEDDKAVKRKGETKGASNSKSNTSNSRLLLKSTDFPKLGEVSSDTGKRQQMSLEFQKSKAVQPTKHVEVSTNPPNSVAPGTILHSEPPWNISKFEIQSSEKVVRANNPLSIQQNNKKMQREDACKSSVDPFNLTAKVSAVNTMSQKSNNAKPLTPAAGPINQFSPAKQPKGSTPPSTSPKVRKVVDPRQLARALELLTTTILSNRCIRALSTLKEHTAAVKVTDTRRELSVYLFRWKNVYRRVVKQREKLVFDMQSIEFGDNSVVVEETFCYDKNRTSQKVQQHVRNNFAVAKLNFCSTFNGRKALAVITKPRVNSYAAVNRIQHSLQIWQEVLERTGNILFCKQTRRLRRYLGFPDVPVSSLLSEDAGPLWDGDLFLELTVFSPFSTAGFIGNLDCPLISMMRTLLAGEDGLLQHVSVPCRPEITTQSKGQNLVTRKFHLATLDSNFSSSSCGLILFVPVEKGVILSNWLTSSEFVLNGILDAISSCRPIHLLLTASRTDDDLIDDSLTVEMIALVMNGLSSLSSCNPSVQAAVGVLNALNAALVDRFGTIPYSVHHFLGSISVVGYTDPVDVQHLFDTLLSTEDITTLSSTVDNAADMINTAVMALSSTMTSVAETTEATPLIHMVYLASWFRIEVDQTMHTTLEQLMQAGWGDRMHAWAPQLNSIDEVNYQDAFVAIVLEVMLHVLKALSDSYNTMVDAVCKFIRSSAKIAPSLNFPSRLFASNGRVTGALLLDKNASAVNPFSEDTDQCSLPVDWNGEISITKLSEIADIVEGSRLSIVQIKPSSSVQELYVGIERSINTTWHDVAIRQQVLSEVMEGMDLMIDRLHSALDSAASQNIDDYKTLLLPTYNIFERGLSKHASSVCDQLCKYPIQFLVADEQSHTLQLSLQKKYVGSGLKKVYPTSPRTASRADYQSSTKAYQTAVTSRVKRQLLMSPSSPGEQPVRSSQLEFHFSKVMCDADRLAVGEFVSPLKKVKYTPTIKGWSEPSSRAYEATRQEEVEREELQLLQVLEQLQEDKQQEAQLEAFLAKACGDRNIHVKQYEADGEDNIAIDTHNYSFQGTNALQSAMNFIHECKQERELLDKSLKHL